MKLPDLSKQSQLGTNDYMVQADPAAEKKKLYLIIGGVIALLLVLSFLIFGNKPTPGLAEMRGGLQATSDALGIVDEYQDKLSYAPTKNDIALTQTLLRGNFQNLNEIYNTFKPKKRFTSNPKPDKKSTDRLDEAVRNNTIDNNIIEVLRPKITKAESELKKAKSNFTKKESSNKIQTAIDDLQSIQELLNRAR